MISVAKKCRDCGSEFHVQRDPEEDEWVANMTEPRRCAPCEEAFQAMLEAREQERLKQEEEAAKRQVDARREAATRRVEVLTPSRYLDTQSKHPDFNLDLWRKVSAWSPTPERPWLGIVGGTGLCKSRCAFTRLRYLATEMAGARSVKIEALTGYQLTSTILGQFGTTPEAAKEAKAHLQRIHDADILLLDELGKVRGTPAVLAELFALLDERHADNLPTLWTSNTPPEAFCATWGEEYSQPSLGRIVECSLIVRA